MDAEKLINAVRSRKSLWYQKDMNYHNRDVNQLLWSEVADEMGTSIERVRKKWKSLRDVFRSEVKKLPKSKPGDGASESVSSSWAYFTHMLFVKDQMTTRQLKKTLSNLESTSLRYEDFEDTDYEVKSVTLEKDNTTSSDNEVNSISDTCKRRQQDSRYTQKARLAKRKVAFDNNLVNIKQQKQSTCQENASPSTDADYHFLMSFLPAMKDMATPIKMLFRLRMQELLYQCTVNSNTMLITNCGNSETPAEEVVVTLPPTINSVTSHGI